MERNNQAQEKMSPETAKTTPGVDDSLHFFSIKPRMSRTNKRLTQTIPSGEEHTRYCCYNALEYEVRQAK